MAKSTQFTKTSTDKMNVRGAMLAFDAVVIGSGIAGMTAAAFLARAGYRVAVLERDVHPGGCAARFSHKGYTFAVGATVGMGFAPGGLHNRIYNMLGLTADYVPVSPALRVHLLENNASNTTGDTGSDTTYNTKSNVDRQRARHVWIHTDRQQWRKEVARAFPSSTDRERRAKEHFWQRTAQLAAGLSHAANHFPVMPFTSFCDVWDTACAAHPRQWANLLNVLAHLHHTVADLASDIDDPYHRAFVDGQLLDAMQTTAEHCAAPNGALALDIYRMGCQYKTGGLATIAHDLETYLRANGGHVFYSTLAKEILTEASTASTSTPKSQTLKSSTLESSVQGVATNRATFCAPVVISAVPLQNTAMLLSPDTPTTLTKRATLQPKMWGAFTLYLGVDARVLPKDLHLFEQVTTLDVHAPAGNCLISTSPPWDTTRAPQGKRAITVSTHVDTAQWLALGQDKARYKKAKEEFAGVLLERVRQVIPNLDDGLEVNLAGTPKTFYGFTRRIGGTVGGIPQTTAYANFAAPSHHTDIPGLFLAGDTVFPGQGTLGVSVSGYNAARSATRWLRHVSPETNVVASLSSSTSSMPTSSSSMSKQVASSSTTHRMP